MTSKLPIFAVMNNIFITGIGTGVGKTVASACVTEALGAQYWKPIQAGLQDTTDTQTVRALISEPSHVKDELYRLHMPASPHLAASREGITIYEEKIVERAMFSEDTVFTVQINTINAATGPLVVTFEFLPEY